MTLKELKDIVAKLEKQEIPDTLELKVYNGINRLVDFNISIEMGGIDSKDKYSNVGHPCLIVYGVLEGE
jgi:hypothetical protein